MVEFLKSFIYSSSLPFYLTQTGIYNRINLSKWGRGWGDKALMFENRGQQERLHVSIPVWDITELRVEYHITSERGLASQSD